MPCRIKLYYIFLDGFLIQVEQNKILKWNLKESAQLFNENNKVTFISSKDIKKFKHYVYIPEEKVEEFLSFFGQPAFKALKFILQFRFTPKVSKNFLYLLLIFYYLIFPVMSIVIFFKVLFKGNIEEQMFNYYHATNIPEELYEKILKNSHPRGFYLQERKKIIRRVIKEHKDDIKGLWLDLGCGINSLLVEAEQDQGAEIYLLDPNPNSEKAFKEYKNKFINTKLKFVRGRGEELPFDDNYFSFIYCGGVIAHVCYFDKLLYECKRVLKPGGLILFDESNECPRNRFMNTLYTTNLKKIINSNHNICENYSFKPPKDYISNPWSYWGCSTDHFWIFNLKGLSEYLCKFFDIKKKGGIGSYLCNNGSCEGFPLFYPLDLGSLTDLYIDFINLPKWYLKMISNIYGDTGIYIYTLCQKQYS